MSRSLGLREDQHLREQLTLRMAEWFPVDAWWLVRRPVQRHPADACRRIAGVGLPPNRSERLTD
ncbi:hypothetical protein [Pseudomonas sp. LD120]|uniref:hypothetical protein n=1 Tax=Pseudomonas sp. LD120 TaxID=485751 RepID=UPI002114BB4E|nr:hypothetical protein [Pseudomonas sp. LD120]